MYYFQNLPFTLTVVEIVVILSVLFGIVHLYQGWKGVLGTAYLGGLFVYLYLVTGNLWLCIGLYFPLDVKFVFFPNGKLNNDFESATL